MYLDFGTESSLFLLGMGTELEAYFLAPNHGEARKMHRMVRLRGRYFGFGDEGGGRRDYLSESMYV